MHAQACVTGWLKHCYLVSREKFEKRHRCDVLFGSPVGLDRSHANMPAHDGINESHVEPVLHHDNCYVDVRETCRVRSSRLGCTFEPPLVEQRLVGRDATRRGGGVRRPVGVVGVGTPYAVGPLHDTSNSTRGWLMF